jgi:hypothetical protein
VRLSYFGTRPTRISTDLRPPASPTPKRMKGLGDLVERFTEKTGIKSIVEKRAKRRGRGCGCSKRRDALNALVPFRTEDESTETSND